MWVFPPFLPPLSPLAGFTASSPQLLFEPHLSRVFKFIGFTPFNSITLLVHRLQNSTQNTERRQGSEYLDPWKSERWQCHLLETSQCCSLRRNSLKDITKLHLKPNFGELLKQAQKKTIPARLLWIWIFGPTVFTEKVFLLSQVHPFESFHSGDWRYLFTTKKLN